MESVEDAEVAYESADVAELLDTEDVILSVEEVRSGVGGFMRLAGGRAF